MLTVGNLNAKPEKTSGSCNWIRFRHPTFSTSGGTGFTFLAEKNDIREWMSTTHQGINISHLGKRKIIFKYAILGGYVSFLEGTHPRLVVSFGA